MIGAPGDPLLARMSQDPRFASRYRIKGSLGRGGFARVALAEQLSTGRDVAIKILETTWEPVAAERFQREGRVLAALKHPGILQVYDQGFLAGSPFLVMELAPNGTLRDLLRKVGRLDVARVVEIVQPCLRALALCHAEGVLHRDIKPDNILFGADDLPRLADFGLAQTSAHALTETGVFIGTIQYTAPEVLTGDAPSVASDLFAIGVMLYEMLAGKLPFQGKNPAEIYRQLCDVHPAPLAEVRPELPREIGEQVSLCLAKRPARRPQSADALADALEQWTSFSLPAPRDSASQRGTEILPVLPSHPSPDAAPRLRPARAAGLTALALVALCAALLRAPHGTGATAASPAVVVDDAARSALSKAVAAAEDECANLLGSWIRFAQVQAVPGNLDETRVEARKLADLTGRRRETIRTALALARADWHAGRPMEREMLSLVARGVSCEFTAWWVLENCARAQSAGTPLSFDGQATLPGDLRREPEGLLLVREFADASLALVAAVDRTAQLDGAEIAHALDAHRSVARCATMFDWRPDMRAQLRTVNASYLRRLGQLERPLTDTARGCWNWGYSGAAHKEDRTELATTARAVSTLASRLSQGQAALEELAQRATREAR